MTALVKKRPERYACEKCACEIGVWPEPTEHVLIPGAYGTMSAPPREGDDPLVFDPDCACNCHELWNLVNHGTRMESVPRKRAGGDPPEGAVAPPHSHSPSPAPLLNDEDEDPW